MKKYYVLLGVIIVSIVFFSRAWALSPSGVYVYPDPYKPGSNTIYDNTALGEGIVFAGLPSSARIRIFTISGKLVKDMNVSNSKGTFLWDTTNADNQKCSSGVYLYIVTNQDGSGNKYKGKFAIVE